MAPEKLLGLFFCKLLWDILHNIPNENPKLLRFEEIISTPCFRTLIYRNILNENPKVDVLKKLQLFKNRIYESHIDADRLSMYISF